MQFLYRVIQQVSDLVWVDFHFGCSTVCQILPELMRDGQNGQNRWTRRPEHPTNPGPRTDESPCTGCTISLKTWLQLTFIWDVPPSCPPAQPLLPISNQPTQNYCRQRVEQHKSKSTQPRLARKWATLYYYYLNSEISYRCYKDLKSI